MGLDHLSSQLFHQIDKPQNGLLLQHDPLPQGLGAITAAVEIVLIDNALLVSEQVALLKS